LWGVESVAFDSNREVGDRHRAQHMVNCSEFCDMLDRMEIELVDGPLEAMILVGPKSLNTVEERYGIG
jgi:hypothetical protein